MQQILGIKWYDTELKAKLQSIKDSCGAYGEQAATLFRAAIDAAEKDVNDENMKKQMIEKLLKDVVYTEGKHGPAITIRGVWEKPLSCEDARPEDFAEKFGIPVAQKETHISYSRLRNTLGDMAESYLYTYKQSGLAGLEPAIRERYMPTPEQLEKLIKWGGDTLCVGSILASLLNATRLPGALGDYTPFVDIASSYRGEGDDSKVFVFHPYGLSPKVFLLAGYETTAIRFFEE